MVFQFRRNVEKMFKGIKRLRKMLESLANYVYGLKKKFQHYLQTLFEAYESHCFPVYMIHKNMSWLFRFVFGEALSIKRNDNAEATIGSDISTICLLSKPTDAGKGVLFFLTKSDCTNFISDDLIQDCFRRGKASFQSYTLPTELNKTLTEVKDVYNLMSDEYGYGRLTPQLTVTNTNICDTNKLDTKANSIENCPEINPEKKKPKGNQKANYRVPWKVLWVVSLLSMIYQTNANPLDTSSLKEYTFSALSSSTCNPRNLNMTQSCILNSDVLSIHMEYCGFTCSSDVYEPVCVNVERGMVHICAPSKRLCAKGYRWYPWLDKDNKTVHVKEEKCPKGSYQPYETDCFHACTMTHLNINDIPEKYLLYSEGDNVSPSYVYCNYKKGYFNRGHTFKLDYDEESMHEPYFCSNVDNFNPCSDSLIPLPNGTCVKPCLYGECRDDHDGFICKPNCRESQLDRNSSETAGVECVGKSNTCRNGVCKRFFGRSSCQCNQGFRSDNKTKNCIDVDECREMKGLCENGKCTNTFGSHNCLCHDGYELNSNTRRCIPSGGGDEDKRTPYLPTSAITIIITVVIAVCGTVAVICVYRFRLCARILKRLRRVNRQEDDVSYSDTYMGTRFETTERSDDENEKSIVKAQINIKKGFEAVVNSATDTMVYEQEDGTERKVVYSHENRDENFFLLKQKNRKEDEIEHKPEKSINKTMIRNARKENCPKIQFNKAVGSVTIYNYKDCSHGLDDECSNKIDNESLFRRSTYEESFDKDIYMTREDTAQAEITFVKRLENGPEERTDCEVGPEEMCPFLPKSAEPDLCESFEDRCLLSVADLQKKDKSDEITNDESRMTD